MRLTEGLFIEELIASIRSDEAVAKSQLDHPEAWASEDYAGKQAMRRAIARTVRAGLQSFSQKQIRQPLYIKQEKPN